MTRASAPLTLEILGAPGAGKSTLAAALCTDPSVVLVKNHSLRDVWAFSRSGLRALPGAVRCPSQVDRLRWAAWAARLSAAPDVARRRSRSGSATVVFDQGPSYTLMRMSALRSHARGDAWWWSRCAETGSLLGLLVLVEAEANTLAERVLSRSKSHVARALPAPSVEDYVAGEQRACRALADVLEDLGTPVLRLDTARAPADDQGEFVLGALRGHPTGPIVPRKS